MIVVTLTDCPPRLRGDLSKWLLEINTGVYVGQLNRRVREELWKRICDNLPRGRAAMVYSANNEQRMGFLVHNTTWQPTDFEGVTLMRRPRMTEPEAGPKPPMGKAAVSRMAGKKRAAQVLQEQKAGYVVIDMETTGLDPEQDEILELAAVRVIDHRAAETFSSLIRPRKGIPEKITALTGITPEMAREEGGELAEVLERFWQFVGKSPLVGHNLDFDCGFLKKAGPPSRLSGWDTLTLARRRVRDVPDHRLETLAAYFGIEPEGRHRALADCMTTFRIYEKLNEI